MALLRDVDGAALCTRLMEDGVPAAPILDVSNALEHPHTEHRGMVVRMPGGYQGLGAPVKLSHTPATYRLPPPDEN